MSLPDSSILTNIQVPGRGRPGDILFEKKYITTRGLENRLYTDEDLQKLPDIDADHTHYQEWQIRKRSSQRLIRYLAGKKRSLNILEIGCGNGWLSHQLAGIPGTQVTGVDINFTELQQAARVFSDDPNLVFIHGDIRSGILSDSEFDCILFAASIQYFSSFKKIIHFSLMYLRPGGEIHIADTPFYRAQEIDKAKRRTIAYYSSLGYPEMADFYFHHSRIDLRSFHYKVAYDPHSFRSRLLRKKDPFPWIRITKQ